MRILGIDPGIATTGFGVIEVNSGRLSKIEVGTIETKPGIALSERLGMINAALAELIRRLHPSAMAVEELFFSSNAKTAFVVGQARGVILLTGHQCGLSIVGYTPLQVKMAVCGYGRADKRQVQDMVKRLLGLASLPRPDDAADALAIAICHAHSYRLKSLE